MRNFLLIVFCLSGFNALQCQTWNLIWQDEFNGNSLDQTKWSHDLGTGATFGLNGWGNGELQYYQPDNTAVGGGTLVIEAREEPQGISDVHSGFQPYFYSSSKITTRNKFDFRHGRVEARIKTIDGEGYWPAFWMLPLNGCWPGNGEIDIMEQWGNNGDSNVTTGAAHTGVCGDGSSTYSAGSTNLGNGSYADQFHTYSVIWYEDFIGWYVDDVLFHSVNPTTFPSNIDWPFNENDWYIILNLAITSSGINSNTTIPNDIEVDWVRVYQTNDILGCTDSGASNYNPEANVDDGNCLYDFTFNVNMNCSGITYNQVYVTGPFAGWCGDCYPLTDSNDDGIWTATYSFPQGDLEYKYAVDNWAHQENLLDDMQNGASCAPVTDFANYANRLVNLNVEFSNDTYGSCELCNAEIAGCTDPAASNYNPSATIENGSCVYEGCTDSGATNFDSSATVDDGSCLYAVTFNVDMSCSGEVFNTVGISGPFSNWCGSCYELSDANQDEVWSGTFEFPAGDLEYKYLIDNWVSQEDLLDDMINGGSCAPVTDFQNWANRQINVQSAISTNDTYGSCSECPEVIIGCTNSLAANYIPEATEDDGSCNFEVTFIVDMSTYQGSFNNLYVSGSWSGWCGNCNLLTDDNNDEIFEGVVFLPQGLNEFKFSVDNWSDQEEFIGGEDCTLVTGEFVNRTLLVDAPETYGAVCWESCSSCSISGCTDYDFIEYNPLAESDDGSCLTLKVYGCTYSDAMNYSPQANTDDDSCVFITDNCYGDFNEDGFITASDLTQFLAVFGLSCE